MPIVKRRRRRSRGHGWGARLVLLTLVLALAGGAVYHYTRPGAPNRWRIQGNELHVADVSGRPLWHYTFPEPFQPALEDPQEAARWFFFGDIDGDGKLETLVNYRPEHAEKVGSVLYCLSVDGKLKWDFRPGHRVEDQTTEYPQNFVVSSFKFLPSQVGRGAYLAVSSHHASGHPNQVALLDANGNIVSEYWHSGHLTEIATADLSGNSQDELLLAGMDAGRKQGTLIWLDPRQMGGASTEEPGDPHQLKGFAPAKEKTRIYFPAVQLSGITPIGLEVRVSAPPLTYVFDKKLNLITIEGAGDKLEELRSQVTIVR